MRAHSTAHICKILGLPSLQRQVAGGCGWLSGGGGQRHGQGGTELLFLLLDGRTQLHPATIGLGGEAGMPCGRIKLVDFVGQEYPPEKNFDRKNFRIE